MVKFASVVMALIIGSKTVHTCEEVQKLTMDEQSDYFFEVSLYKNKALNSASYTAEGIVDRAVYVHVRGDSGWTQEQILLASDVDASAGWDFGRSLSLFGNRALVSDPQNYGTPGTVAFMYLYSNNKWSLEKKIIPNDGQKGDVFGWTVSLYDNRALIGAYGSAYVFSNGNNGWEQEAKLTVDGNREDNFGMFVSLYENRALIGAFRENDEQGAAYIFINLNNAWSLEKRLVDTSGVPGNMFGYAVSLHGKRALILDVNGRKNGIEDSGAAYTFILHNNEWIQEAELLPDNDTDHFGYSISLYGDRVLIGTKNNQASAFLFSYIDGKWINEKTIRKGAWDVSFGTSVSLYENSAIVSEPYVIGTSSFRSSIYLYDCPTNCNCLECSHSSAANSDPHYTIWSGEWYDFQGGCDQIAIDNPRFQLQIRTRPRTSYSAITQVALFFKKTKEVFRIREVGGDTQVEQDITNLSGASYSFDLPSTHRIDFDGPADESFILVHYWGGEFYIQVKGKGHVFCDSEGMFGSWNYGGVRLRDGTIFDLLGDYDDNKARSIQLAASWVVPIGESKLWSPSAVCDASSSCGLGEAFECDETRRLRSGQKRFLQNTCDKTCGDLPTGLTRDQCLKDVDLTGLNDWACSPNYQSPIIVESSPCEFLMNADTCAPTTVPTKNPTKYPSQSPLNDPTKSPTESPTKSPTRNPIISPTEAPSKATISPTIKPSKISTVEPTKTPSNPIDFPTSSPFGQPTSPPTKMPSKPMNPSTAAPFSPPAENSGLFYPNWNGNIETCLNDGHEPGYMKSNPAAWLYNTLEGCCDRYFGWAKSSCILRGSHDSVSGLYFPDWEGKNDRCLNDGSHPNYMLNNPEAWMHATIEECCSREYNWMYDDCVLNSGGDTISNEGSSKWYVDWDQFMCVKDCQVNATDVNCGGLVKKWDVLFLDAKTCCTQKLYWLEDSNCTANGME